jgi:hypothetical protein
MLGVHPNSTPQQSRVREHAEGVSAHPQSPSALPASDSPFFISPADAAILESLFAPSATLASVAATHALSAPALALFLTQPHIQAAYQALLALEAHFEKRWREQRFRANIDTLAEVMQTSDNPVERRRAATESLRALARTQSPGPQSRGRKHAEGASDSPCTLVNAGGPSRSASPCPEPSFSPAPLATTPSEIRNSRSEIARDGAPHHPLDASTPRCLDASPPQHSAPSTQHSPKDDPNFIPDYTISRLTKLRKKTSTAALREIAGVLRGPSLATEDGARAFTHNLEQLVAVTATHPDVEPSPASIEPDGLHAHKPYTFRAPSGERREFLLRLYSDRGSTNWWLEEIVPIDST